MTLFPQDRSHRLRRNGAGVFQRFILTAAFAVLASASAFAGRYELVKGKGVEVCEAYGKNLNSFPLRLPMRHERQVSPQFKKFAKPQWKRWVEWPIPDNASLLTKIDRFLWERDVDHAGYFPTVEGRKWRGTSEQHQQAWERFELFREKAGLVGGPSICEIDLDNDGRPDYVYRDEYRGRLLLVLDHKLSDIDFEKSKLITQHPSRREHGSVQDGDTLNNVSYDIFTYKTKTYFDIWWYQHPDFQGKLDFQVGKLRVFVAENNAAREVCTYEFQDTK